MEERTRTGKPGWPGRWLYPCLCVGVALGCGVGSSGCTRHFFRKRADKEVAEVLTEKDRYAPWRIEHWHIYPDPRARFADTTDPDRPPMPPDDPAVWDLSPHAQKPGKAGVARIEGTSYLDLLAAWDAENRSPAMGAEAKAQAEEKPKDGAPKAPQAEEKPQEGKPSAEGLPACASDIPAQRPRPFLLTAEQAVELGLINSREFQDRREDLYLTALPVTLERFAFAAQFFAAGQLIRERTGRETPQGEHNRWRATPSTGFSKLFSTGALLLFQFANQTVVELSGRNKGTTSQSILNLDLIQPLLRGGGRAVTLEPLTQVERNLLYEIRDYAHFRKDFFAFIVAGSDFTRGSIITPSALSRAILPATVSVGPGGGRLQVAPGAGGRLGALLPGTAPSAGYLPTLVLSAILAVDRENVTALEGFLRLFEAIKESGDISQLQVDNVESQLLTGRNTVLADEQNYLNSLDELKLQLGVPMDLPLELDDTVVRPITRQFRRFRAVLDEFQAAQDAATRYDAPAEARLLRGRLRQLFTNSALVQGTTFRTEFPRRWAAWEKLSAKELSDLLEKYGAERRALLIKKTESEKQERPLPPAQQRRLEEVIAEIDLGFFEQALRIYMSEPWTNQPDPERRQRQREVLFRTVLNAFAVVLGAARNERIQQVRRGWPDLPRVCVHGADLLRADPEEAQTVVTQTALVNRFDLMNQRAQLVDAWRQVAVAANALLGTFNVQYHLDSSTPPGQNRPFDVGGSRSRHQLILDWNLPLVRRVERNGYRSALIAYQRQRRALMAEEDLVVNTVRLEIRQLRLLAENYRIQQRATELAYFQVENSLDTFRQPPTPGSPTGGGNTQANAAALTTQLLTAQMMLVRTQIQMLNVWINYQIFRIQLYRELELMPLDFRGVWTDDIATCECGPADPGRTTQTSDREPSAQRSVPERQGRGGPEQVPVPPAASAALGEGP